MTGRPSRSVRLYVGAVIVTGAVVLGWAIVQSGGTVVRADETFWLFAALLLAGEFFYISIPRADEVDEITVSTTFTFAILIAFGTGPAVIAQALGSVVSDVVTRKAPWKIAFNAS